MNGAARSSVSRRQVLAGAGLMAGAVTLVPADTQALGAAPERAMVVLQDARLALPADLQVRLAANGARVMQLDADPVRMWRGGSAALLNDRATQLLGATQWPQFLLVRGLAAESGRRVRYQRFDAASGATIWLIG
ncbi:MAG: hypothetical protein ABW278_02465 [Steroidobacteraceae bacterium]